MFDGLQQLINAQYTEETQRISTIKIKVNEDIHLIIEAIVERLIYFGRMMYGNIDKEKDIVFLRDDLEMGYVEGQNCIIYLRQVVGYDFQLERPMVYMPDCFFKINEDLTIQTAGLESFRWLQRIQDERN